MMDDPTILKRQNGYGVALRDTTIVWNYTLPTKIALSAMHADRVVQSFSANLRIVANAQKFRTCQEKRKRRWIILARIINLSSWQQVFFQNAHLQNLIGFEKNLSRAMGKSRDGYKRPMYSQRVQTSKMGLKQEQVVNTKKRRMKKYPRDSFLREN